MRFVTHSLCSIVLARMLLLSSAGLLCFETIASFAQPLEPPQKQAQRGSRRGRLGSRDNLVNAARDPILAAKVKLTDEQLKKLEDLRMQLFTAIRSAESGQEIPDILNEFEQQAVDILTPDQLPIWARIKEELKSNPAGSDAEQKGQSAQQKSAESTGTTVTRSTADDSAKTATRHTNFADVPPPDGVKATASFQSRPDDTTAKGRNGSNSEGPSSAGPRLEFNFRYAPWDDVLKLFAEASNLTLDLNDVPPGTFNYYDDKAYTVTEALDVLNGYLLPKGYVLIRRDRFLVSLNMENGIPPNLIPNVSIEDLPQRGANELISLVLPLQELEADKIVDEVKELLGPQGKVASLKNTNSLVLMDTGSNINRISRLLKPGTPMENKETAFRALPLKHISAAEAERTIRRLFNLNPMAASTNNIQQPGGPQSGVDGSGRGGRGFRGGDPNGQVDGGNPRAQGVAPVMTITPPQSPYVGKIQVTADPRTNHLLVTASSALVKVIEDIVRSIDIDKDASGKTVVTNDSPAFLKAYSVLGGDPIQISRTLNSLMPGLVVGEDPKSGKLHVHATREEHAEIQNLIQALAGETSGSVAVIALHRLDPIQATNTLRNLFTNDTRAPMIEPDMFGRRLLVRGSAEQLAQVKKLLTDLGEVENAPRSQLGGEFPNPTGNPETEAAERKSSRVINLGGRDPADVLPLIRQIWEAEKRNPILVVVPSRTNPIRERRIPSEKNAERIDPPRDPNRPKTDRPGDERESRLNSSPNIFQETALRTLKRPRHSILQVSRAGETGPDDHPFTSLVTTSTTNDPAKEQTDNGKSDAEETPIEITILGNDLVLSSTNNRALDELENMIQTLASAMSVRTRWTIFYLRSADATDTAFLLERLLSPNSVSASSSRRSGEAGVLSNATSSVVRGMTATNGLDQTLGGTGNLRIITDVRSNALFVTGSQEMILDVESLLELLDASELPESLRDRQPRSIPVEFAAIDDVYEIVNSVFKQSTTSESPPGGPAGTNQRFNPLAMLMGGGANPSRSNPSAELTIGIDRRTSHLIVSCKESLYRQVEELVKSLDQHAKDARHTVKILRLETADPVMIRETLKSLNSKISSTGSGVRKKQDPNQSAASTPSGAAQPPAATRDAEILRSTMEQRSRGRSGGRGSQFDDQNFPGGVSREGNSGRRGGRSEGP